MKKLHIPHTDLAVSRIAYGCAGLADWDNKALTGEDKARGEQIIRTVYEQGINLFDHADVYAFGKSEMLFGQVLKSSPGLRERLIIQSKCGQVFDSEWKKWGDPIRVDLRYKHIIGSVNGTLERLGTDYLDILLLHAPSTLVEPEEIAWAFDELHRLGKVRHFGVSNYSAIQIQLLKKAVTRPLIVNQIQLGLGHPEVLTDGIEFTIDLVRGSGGKRYLAGSDSGILDYCRLQDIQIQAWSPLRGDLFTTKLSPSRALRSAVDKLHALARKKDTTPASLGLAWLLHHPAKIIPVMGSTNTEHLIQNCAADQLTLTDAEWYDLLAAVANLAGRTARSPGS